MAKVVDEEIVVTDEAKENNNEWCYHHQW
jgi:hypothetical protein